MATDKQARRDIANLSGQQIKNILVALDEYGACYRQLYDGPIGEDGVLGDAFERILNGVRDLLNGELGSHDGGTLDRWVCGIGKNNSVEGFE